jgi:hypothetical protein
VGGTVTLFPIPYNPICSWSICLWYDGAGGRESYVSEGGKWTVAITCIGGFCGIVGSVFLLAKVVVYTNPTNRAVFVYRLLVNLGTIRELGTQHLGLFMSA